eukprot:jgi/Mesvir1/23839/Mv10644-RA.1
MVICKVHLRGVELFRKAWLFHRPKGRTLAVSDRDPDRRSAHDSRDDFCGASRLCGLSSVDAPRSSRPSDGRTSPTPTTHLLNAASCSSSAPTLPSEDPRRSRLLPTGYAAASDNVAAGVSSAGHGSSVVLTSTGAEQGWGGWGPQGFGRSGIPGAPHKGKDKGTHRAAEGTVAEPSREATHGRGGAGQGELMSLGAGAKRDPYLPSGTPTAAPSVTHTKSETGLTVTAAAADTIRRAVSHSAFSTLSVDDDCCPTCLEGYTEEDPRIDTRCGHHFHLACIYEWQERSTLCPVCSKEMHFQESF